MLPSDRACRVVVAVATKVVDEDFGSRDCVPLDKLLDAGPHLLVVDVLVQVDPALSSNKEVDVAGATVNQPATLSPNNEEVWSNLAELAQKRVQAELLEVATKDGFVVKNAVGDEVKNSGYLYMPVLPHVIWLPVAAFEAIYV